MRILVTGSREPSVGDVRLILRELGLATREAIDKGEPVVIVHGAAPGVDTIAKRWAIRTDGVAHEPHPADWRYSGGWAGHIRNQAMVSQGADLCLAFPGPGSRGTYDCMRRAEEAGIPVKVCGLEGS
jgi:hypothetical protein